MPYTTFPQVQDILNGTSQDIHSQLSPTTNPGQGILIDYTNRVHKQVLRFSRWTFLSSDFLFFLTDRGQTKYWLGAAADQPPGTVDTGLHLTDVDKVNKQEVYDITNLRELKWLSSPPIGPNIVTPSGVQRPGLPSNFCQNPNNPFILELYPAPDNQNTNQPFPQVPVMTTVSGGALAARTYIVKVTFTDQLGGESTASSNLIANTAAGGQIFVGANRLATIKSPVVPIPSSTSGQMYNGYNVYASVATIVNGNVTNEGSETLQNVTPIPIGTDWTEPSTGLTTTGRIPPIVNTLQPIGAYIIRFKYYKSRVNLGDPNDFLQVPDDYKDIVINGVNAYAFKLLGKSQEAQQNWQLYRSGLTEMIWDKNLFPEGVSFIRPDVGSYVNQQILGFLPPLI
jgi:hypothetical protein